MDRHQLEIKKLIRGLGLKSGRLDQKGSHFKTVVSREGTSQTIIFPISPSDNRWKKNMESYLRKTFSL